MRSCLRDCFVCACVFVCVCACVRVCVWVGGCVGVWVCKYHEAYHIGGSQICVLCAAHDPQCACRSDHGGKTQGCPVVLHAKVMERNKK